MGRREQGAGVEQAGRAWESVRRALGRLVSQVGVRSLSETDRTPAVAVRAHSLAQPTLLALRVGEGMWQPAVAVRQALVPEAQTGTRDGGWTPVVHLAEGDAAPAPPECRAMPIVQAGGCRVISADLLLPAFVVRLPERFLALPPAPVRVQSAGLLAPPALGVLRRWDVAAPPCRALPMPRFSGPRVRWGGDAILSRIALTRRGREAPPDVPFALAFDAEERRLAEAAHLSPDDVTLLGIYPGVPILAVSRIVVADGGRSLRLWLKPDVLRGRNAARLITLLVGRQTSSGKMLQAAL